MTFLFLGTRLAAPLIAAAPLVTSTMALAQTPPSSPVAAVAVDVPVQALGDALRLLARQTSQQLLFSPDQVGGKTAPAVRGQLTPQAALAQLLAGSGLEAVSTGPAIVVRQPDAADPGAAPAPGEDASHRQFGRVIVRGKRAHDIGPLPGLGLTKDQIPGNVQSISAEEIKQAHSLSLADLMNRKLQSVNVNDYQGNPFQMDVTYRGFTAGPQIGTPQGLSVFFDGIRINEPFGDVVNWDMIPMNAVASVDVFPGSNPIFGLNTLGGSFSLKTKDGFSHPGLDVDVLTGSFGRRQFQLAAGGNDGNFGWFGAGNFFLEDGWRDNSPSQVNQVFGKGSYRGEKLDLNLSTLVAWNKLVGNGLYPSEMYEQDRTGIFTAPDTTDNKLVQLQLSGAFAVNDTFSITGQVYRRNSKRHQVGADVMTDYDPDLKSYRRAQPGDEYTCLLASSGTPGVPAYYVIPVDADANGLVDYSATPFYENLSANYYSDPASPDGRFYLDPVAFAAYKNTPLPNGLVSMIQQHVSFWKNERESIVYNRGIRAPAIGGPALRDPSGRIVTDADGHPVSEYAVNSTFVTRSWTDPHGSNIHFETLDQTYFYSFKTTGGVTSLVKNEVVFASATNNDKCFEGHNKAATEENGQVDGAGNPDYPLGVIDGTPTAVFNDNTIRQIVNGASIQFNWNLDRHRFMVGASIDAASADYMNTTQLGFLDSARNAYLDPAQAREQFIGAFQPISNNNFSGTNTTRSVYVSETWTPAREWNLSASARYNTTHTKNTIAARYGLGAYGIGDLVSFPDSYNVCDGDCTTSRPPTYYRPSVLLNTLDTPGTEAFSFHSFNPAIGAIWQATDRLNAFVNLARGTRTPSVIELGCAFDKTLVLSGRSDTDGDGILDTDIYSPRSIVENRQCTLPTTLSGDPFLPQIKATTLDLGLRGNVDNNLKWNVGVYQTHLKDDIYFVAQAGSSGAGFFDTIGNTRRRGFEAGVSGRKKRWGFGLNYSLTEATFQSDFIITSTDNSSSFVKDGYGNVIQVRKGDRMPGVPLHNFNGNLSYDVTDGWTIGMSTVMHSRSYVRGNENNAHQVGALILPRGSLGDEGDALRLPASNPGHVPGYAVFNLQSSLKLASRWTATLIVNNLFDKQYFTAGRLGRNPFSPSIRGAIGPDGYNHNSNDWRSTNFISPSAPRGVWVSLNYQFDAAQ